MADEITEPQSVAEATKAAHESGVYFDDAETVETEEVVETEAVETEVEEVVETETEPVVETETVETETDDDPYAALGGLANLKNLHAIQRGISTDAGLRQFVASALHELGYTPEQVDAALNGTPVTTAETTTETTPDPLGDIADDDIVTGAQVKELLQAVRDEIGGVTKTLAEQRQEERQATVTAAVDNVLIEMLGDPTAADPAASVDPNLAQLALSFAANHLDPNEWDPAKVAAIVRTGVNEMKAMLDQTKASYIKKKATTKAAQPTSTGGGGAQGGDPVADPKNIGEAIRMVREGGYY